MNIHKAEYESALDRLRADMENHKTDGPQEIHQMVWTAVMVAVGIAFLGSMLTR